MTVQIHGIAASRAARPLWAAEELGIAYEHVEQDYRHGATRTPAFLSLNPNGHIPVVVDGDVVVWESMACTLYLANRFGAPLAPLGQAEQAATLRWTFWVVTECEKDALTVLMHRAAMPAAQRDGALAEQAERRLAVPLRVIDAHLAERAYLSGDRFNVADLNVASVLFWTHPAHDLLARFPNLRRWLSACLDRPALRRVRAMARRG